MARSKAATPLAATTFDRMTPQRRTIGEVFAAAERPLSTEEVYEAANRKGARASLATVYRFIRALVEDGTLSVVHVPGAGAFYEQAGKAHHHHFSCMRCSRVYELDACTDSELLTMPAGFRAVSHDVTVYGACAACRANDPKTRARRPRG